MFLTSACALNGSPRHSLGELRRALLNHDADGALKYVDVDSIVDHMMENSFHNLDVMGIPVGRAVASALMPPARAVIRKGVRAAIESDDELGYFSQIREASVWYLSIKQDGNTAIVTPRGDDKMRFKMEQTNEGYWRITELILSRRR